MSTPSGIRKILVATDFSPAAATAVERAAELATSSQAELRLVHAVVYAELAEEAIALEAATVEQLRRLAGERLEELATKLRGRGLRVSTLVDYGQPAPVILAAAGAHTDLLVVGTRGLGGWRHLMLGSTAQRVLQRASCPVLAVHAGERQPPPRRRRVLVATDFSSGSREASRRAARVLALGEGDSVVLVHVYHEPVVVSGAVARSPRAVVEANHRQEALAQLEAELEMLRAQGASARWELLEGYPPEALLDAARRLDADFMVMGSRGRTGLAHLLLGSTAERVLQRAPCAVLVVPSSRPVAAVGETVDEGVVLVGAAAAVDEQC
jgi:nucleotide-binding universal stress UspA family protein